MVPISESRWDHEEINRRRIELLLEDPATAPNDRGALVIDETGDRKEGKKTAHVGRQYLSSIGKIDNGVVSVGGLWADERAYYPLEVEPYTPAHHFEGGKEDPLFRTKPQIALELVEAAVEGGTSRLERWWRTSSTASTGGSGRAWRKSGYPTCWP